MRKSWYFKFSGNPELPLLHIGNATLVLSCAIVSDEGNCRCFPVWPLCRWPAEPLVCILSGQPFTWILSDQQWYMELVSTSLILLAYSGRSAGRDSLDRLIPVNTKHLCNICTMLANVEDAGPTLYKCYTNVLCLLGCSDAAVPPNFTYSFRVDLKFGIAGLFSYCTHTSLRGCRCAFWGYDLWLLTSIDCGW